MKTFLTLTLLFLTIHLAKSQNQSQGVIYYDHVDNHYGVVYNAYLAFDKSKSHFVTAKHSLGMSGTNKGETSNDNAVVEVADFQNIEKTWEKGLEVFFNSQTSTMYFSNAFSLVSPTLYVVESVPNFKWTFEKEQKTIGKFLCKKATTEFRGRTYICWYTEEIPLPYGPWKLQGLPGLILEAETKDGFFAAKFKQIKYPDSSIHLPKNEEEMISGKAKFISLNDYIKEQRTEIETTDNRLKVTAQKFNVRVQPFSERDNFLEIFGKGDN
ncbi:GLPGLI family protein [Roseivirga spongicola]|uniref:GLPGLI family protein n=1 Tax=Roseivirga spongicola TaxID=333140 RepID=UPI002AC9CF8B|nr:GLPGLI family protein [Roseivirga spongicola]WPZ08568.1 GLPGLI family protein [Roseivirga spongicola]